MNVLTGIHNFLNIINEHWTMIASIITLCIVIVNKFKSYFSLSQEKQIEIAKAQINVIMLKLVTKAEVSYSEWVKSGEIKRAEVIDQVFTMYPILSKVSNQEEIIVWIDNAIDEALKTMRKIFEENKEENK